MKKKATKILPEVLENALSNSYLLCKPAKTIDLVVEDKHSELENFIIYLLEYRLTNKSINNVAKTLLTLPWNEAYDFLEL